MSRPPSKQIAAKSNLAVIKKVEKRARKEDGVIGPCLTHYKARLAEVSDEHPLYDLTRHLLATFADTEAGIRARMEAKHVGKPNAASNVERSVRNSLMRSAGTNYQGLVSYAIARFLNDQKSAWYVAHPVPKKFAQLLAITFSSGLLGEPPPDDNAPPPPEPVGDSDQDLDDDIELDFDVDGDDTEGNAPSVDVIPDVDVLIRNEAWSDHYGPNEPVLLLSVKTSLADRAGSAARWKTYFDIVTNPCPRAEESDCAYTKLGMRLAHNPHVLITHGIVTANIYKVNSDSYFAQYGELRTNQARANTFMFELRFATRNTTHDLIAPGWQPLSGLPNWLDLTSAHYGLPK